jgi:hypothetical protein
MHNSLTSVVDTMSLHMSCKPFRTARGPCLLRRADMFQFSMHVGLRGQRTLFPAVKTIVPVQPIVCVHLQRTGLRIKFVTVVMDFIVCIGLQ